MKIFFKKYSFGFIILGIVALYFFTRFYNLLGLPIFTDEAIYIRWSQIASNDAAWRFISLTDGKQPMYVWITMILLKLIQDPLIAGRVTSIIAGFGSLIGLVLLSYEIFKNRKIALLTGFLYVLYPFSLVYDRMALYDSLVALFIIWALYFEILLVRYVRLDLALILGMIIGGGMLTKTNANFAFILMPFLLLLFNFRDKEWKKKLGKLILFLLTSLVIANVMYTILRLSPFFHIIEAKNYVFIYPFSEWFMNPFGYFFTNVSAMSNWLFIYATGPLLVLIVSAFVISKKYYREKILLFLWFLVPFIALAFFGKNIYPRFILFMTMPLLILGSYALYHMVLMVRQVWIKALIVIVFLGTFVFNDYFIITDFARAHVPRSDHDQFYAGWPSGVGVKETVAFLEEKSQHEKIYVGTGGTFGLMPFALEIYFFDNPNVKVEGFWPIHDTPPQEVIDASREMTTYFVFYQECPSCKHVGLAPWQWPVEEIYQIEKEEPSRYYTLYQIKAQ